MTKEEVWDMLLVEEDAEYFYRSSDGQVIDRATLMKFTEQATDEWDDDELYTSCDE